jgi:hypothetical protein
MDIHLGFEGSKSNGHGEEMDKEGHMMKIIERLQKDAHAHQADNKNLLKAKDRKGEFNLKLMESLEIIENKLDKESDSRKKGVMDPLRRKEDREALAGIIVTPRNIPIRRHVVVQSHILQKNMGDLEWMK